MTASLDLAVSSVDSGRVGILLNQGAGTFAHAYAANMLEGPLVTSDFNGDGRPRCRRRAPARQPRERAAGRVAWRGLAAPVTYPTSKSAGALVAADWNGDGKPDLAVGADGGLDVLLNQGDGTFAPLVHHPLDAPPAG